MHVSSSELLEYTKGVLCIASWRYTTPPCTPRHSLTKFHEGLHLSKTLPTFVEDTATSSWADPTHINFTRTLANFFQYSSRVERKIDCAARERCSSKVDWLLRSAPCSSCQACPSKPRPRTQTERPFLVEPRWFPRQKLTRTKALPFLKKKRAKRRSWFVPGPLKRGQEHFSCPLLSGPGTLSIHGRARMVYSGPCADVADWSMP